MPFDIKNSAEIKYFGSCLLKSNTFGSYLVHTSVIPVTYADLGICCASVGMSRFLSPGTKH